MNTGSSTDNQCFFSSTIPSIVCGGELLNLRKLFESSFDTGQEGENELEYLLLRAGLFDLQPMNLFHFHICSDHHQWLREQPKKNHYDVCKTTIVRKTTASTYGLRRISKTSALSIWKHHKLPLYDAPICDGCHKTLERDLASEIREESGKLLNWLYDQMTLHTPSTTMSDSQQSSYQQSGESLLKFQQKQDLKEWLVDNGFEGRVQMAKSYNNLEVKSQMK
ncbi:unnamed protein product [Didymodactylos carnosus]|uniref:Uncharacterized protein n=1 Tax=Didymodactylos carnosus TaxID=1234261 RepID=A0A8S2SH46_9BILA|nr:unnamed protein product [Didymodactylos carnosus]CAF4229902.1 unnamed protein product [Didymodactylos carnosus]